MYQYNVHTLTIEQLTNLIASGDNSQRCQLRIKEDGTIFLSSVVGANNLDGIAGRFETFDVNNDYVGEKAANNKKYIKQLFQTIKHWIDNPIPYIDIWISE